jgi:hypothetical protein
MVPNESIGGFSRRPMITIRPLPAIAAICALLILAIPELNRRDTHSAGVTRARRVYTIAGQGENTSAQEQLLHAPTRRLGDVQLTLGRARERVRTGELAEVAAGTIDRTRSALRHKSFRWQWHAGRSHPFGW